MREKEVGDLDGEKRETVQREKAAGGEDKLCPINDRGAISQKVKESNTGRIDDLQNPGKLGRK